MTNLSANVSCSAQIKATLSNRVKHHFSRQHLLAARHFAVLASSIEDKPDNTETEASLHRAYVTGSVVSATAFIEASINEFYLEAADNNKATLNGLTMQHIAILAELWEIVEQHTILGKYQMALAACGKEKFDKGAEPFQGAEALIKMRNALLHYRPEWDDELDEHKKLEDRLTGRFPLNRKATSGSLWFPHMCLGSGCAQWAAEQSAAFITEFSTRLGIPCRTP